jgi:hypothetical protein
MTRLQRHGERAVRQVERVCAALQPDADELELDQPKHREQRPDNEARPALLAKHLEVGRVIGARLVLDVDRLDLGRAARCIGLLRLVEDLVAEELKPPPIG